MNPSITRDWATALQDVFRGEAPPESVLVYEPLALAQEAETPTNLTIMHNVAVGDVLKAHKQFEAMRRNGYWPEGYGYAKYARMAPEWYQKSHNGARLNVLDGFDEILFNYSRLAFPDGSLPLPEVSADVRLPFDPLTAEDDYEDASYRVHRWFNATHDECIAQILICLDTNPEPRLNFHHHYDAGYFVLWIKGVGYVNRVAAYTGFDAVRGAESADVAAVLPAGALIPSWRIRPPSVTLNNLGATLMFKWYYFYPYVHPASRVITWDAQRVTVCDNGITRTWEVGGKCL